MPALKEDQLALVCRALTDAAGLTMGWSRSGPSSRAAAALKPKGSTLSGSSRSLVLVAWALWNGQGELAVAELVRNGDGQALALVGGPAAGARRRPGRCDALARGP